MAKYLGPVCRLCRREGEKLYLKGERCFSPKCAIEKRKFPPGQHGRHEGQLTRIANQILLASCAQSRRPAAFTACWSASSGAITDVALRRRGLTGLNLLQTLESRLDNVVFRMGFAPTARSAQPGDPRPFQRQRSPHRYPVDAAQSRATRSKCGQARVTLTYFKNVPRGCREAVPRLSGWIATVKRADLARFSACRSAPRLTAI